MEIITNPNQNIENLGGLDATKIYFGGDQSQYSKRDKILTKSLERCEIKFGLSWNSKELACEEE